jgi:DNA-binding transcriptional regulator GbsR (MarR family)
MKVFHWEGGKFQMTDVQENLKDQKLKIIAQIAELSRLLGMNPSDGSIDVYEPMTQNRMALSNWLSTTRDSFLKLSLSIGKALDIQLQ